MKKLNIILTMLVLLFAGVSILNAQEYEWNAECKINISGWTNYWFTSAIDPTDSSKKVNDFVWAGGIKYGVTNDFLLGIDILYFNWSKSYPTPVTGEAKFSLTPIFIAGQYNFPIEDVPELLPSIKLGFGFIPTKVITSVSVGNVSVISESNENKFGFEVVTGIEIFAGPEFSIGMNIGYLYNGYADLNGIFLGSGLNGYF
ncbi:MAG: outer membrane beta-barrel protein [Candidatus Firestonebacteria bacterium]